MIGHLLECDKIERIDVVEVDRDDLEGHARLNRMYGRRVDYRECWAHDMLLSLRREERRNERMWL